jgi:translocation and assembly module TamB
MKRLVIGTLALPTALLLAVASGVTWLQHSESGARWLLARVSVSTGQALQFDQLEGDLASGLNFRGLRYDDGELRVHASTAALQAELDWLPPALRIRRLEVDSLLLQPLTLSGEAADLESVLPSLQPPIPVHLERVVVTGLDYRDPHGETLVGLDRIEAGGALDRSLRIEEFSAQRQRDQVQVSGDLGLAPPHAVNLQLESSGELEARGALAGTLDDASVDLVLNQPRLQIRGSISELLRTPEWNLALESPRLDWPPEESAPVATLTDLSVETRGTLSSYRLDLSARLESGELGFADLRLGGSGDVRSFRAETLSLAGPAVELDATGDIDWDSASAMSGRGQVRLDRLDPGAWLEDWPEGAALHGRLGLDWSGDFFRVSDTELGMHGGDLAARADGVYDLEHGVVEGEISWRNLAWPPAANAPLVESREGVASFQGNPDDWRLQGRASLKSGDWPEGVFRLIGQGDRESLRATIPEARILGGTIAGELAWGWTGQQPFDLRLTADQVQTGSLLAAYPGELGGSLEASGELSPLRFDAVLETIHGTLRERPVAIHGALGFETGRVWARQLDLRSGESRLKLDGGLDDPGGLSFEADVVSLADFLDGAHGRLEGRGNLLIGPRGPRFRTTLSGESLSFGEWRADRLSTTPLAAGGPGQEIRIEQVENGDLSIESIRIEMAGERPLDSLRITITEGDTRLQVALDGSIEDWDEPLESGWSGQLSDLSLNHAEQWALVLDEAVRLQASAASLTLEPACFSGTRGAHGCVSGRWRVSGPYSLELDVKALPFGLVEAIADTELVFDQVLSGQLNWARDTRGIHRGDARLDLSPGQVRLEDDDEVLATGPGLFAFEIEDGRINQGDLDLSLPGTGRIDLDFQVPDFRAGLDSAVRGVARVDLHSLTPLLLFFPLLDTLEGEVDIDLALSGTIADPVFDGGLALNGGRVENAASGFSFSEIHLSGEVSEYDRAEINGTFRAGEGGGSLRSTLVFEDILSPVIDLTLQGESLTLIDVPDLTVMADPDIRLNWQNDTLNVDGRIGIPSARLAPSYLPASAVAESPDVRVIAGELPEREPDPLGDAAWRLAGRLEVEMGDEVVVDLDMATANVTGVTEFTWRGGMIPLANGYFDVSGQIQAYGQLLRVTRGRIGFPDIPADNPHLNIRAERDIYGNSQVRRAGLMVAGTLRRPVIEAYTVPATNKHRAQTLLVTGSDFNFEQGVGAVDVGFYILPRVYLSYGIGVFEDGNVISARFDLARGFGIKATSGQRETGLDLNYRIER